MMHIQNPELKNKCSGKQLLEGFLWVFLAPSAPLSILAIVNFVLCPDGPAGEFRMVQTAEVKTLSRSSPSVLPLPLSPCWS